MTTRTKAIEIQKEIENILKKNSLHYNVNYVRNPSLKFINIEISIKVKQLESDMK